MQKKSFVTPSSVTMKYATPHRHVILCSLPSQLQASVNHEKNVFSMLDRAAFYANEAYSAIQSVSASQGSGAVSANEVQGEPVRYVRYLP